LPLDLGECPLTSCTIIHYLEKKKHNLFLLSPPDLLKYIINAKHDPLFMKVLLP
jgi:hypothetical protein